MEYIVQQDRRFQFLKNLFNCFVEPSQAGFCREILNSNPAERLDDYPFILSLPAVRINGVPFSLVLSLTRVANHALVFSIRALSKFRVLFVCKAFLRYTPLWRFCVAFSCIFLVCSVCQ